MPSPFPGMDPYLEHPGWWPDFHARFVPICCDELLEVLPEAYDARIEVMESVDEGRDYWIRVIYRPTDTIVAMIKILSSMNKAGVGFDRYQQKRAEVISRGAHLVEVNLLVEGRRPEIGSDWPAKDYFVLVSRADQQSRVDIWTWSIRDRLPRIAIPLRSPDPGVVLHLGRVFAATYDRGRYARAVNYAVPPVAPLRAADRAWAADRARAATSSGHPPTASP